jgi:hypothetical protein
MTTLQASKKRTPLLPKSVDRNKGVEATFGEEDKPGKLTGVPWEHPLAHRWQMRIKPSKANLVYARRKSKNRGKNFSAEGGFIGESPYFRPARCASAWALSLYVPEGVREFQAVGHALCGVP